MAMLHRSCCHWTEVENFNESIKRHKDGVCLGKNIMMVDSAKLCKDHIMKTSKEMDITGPPAFEEDDVQVAAWMPFVDFKRRSKVRKSEHYGSAKDNEEITKSDGLSVGQHKRRRLVRPKFSQNEACSSVVVGNNGTYANGSKDDKLLDHVGQEEKKVDLVSSSCSIAEKNVESPLSLRRKGDNDMEELLKNVCREKVPFSVPSRFEGNENRTLQSADHVVGMTFQIGDEGKKLGTERGFPGEAKEAGDVEGVDASENVGIQPVPLQLALKDKLLTAEEDLGFKNAEVEGVLQHLIGESYPVLHGAALAMHGEAVETGIELGSSFSSGIVNVGSSMNNSKVFRASDEQGNNERYKRLLSL